MNSNHRENRVPLIVVLASVIALAYFYLLDRIGFSSSHFSPIFKFLLVVYDNHAAWAAVGISILACFWRYPEPVERLCAGCGRHPVRVSSSGWWHQVLMGWGALTRQPGVDRDRPLGKLSNDIGLDRGPDRRRLGNPVGNCPRRVIYHRDLFLSDAGAFGGECAVRLAAECSDCHASRAGGAPGVLRAGPAQSISACGFRGAMDSCPVAGRTTTPACGVASVTSPVVNLAVQHVTPCRRCSIRLCLFC